jgi:hypothetical protein
LERRTKWFWFPGKEGNLEENLQIKQEMGRVGEAAAGDFSEPPDGEEDP